MGWTVLYIAFGIVALWLLGEVLLQYKARLRWRLLAFVGFLGVVFGVLIQSIVVIGLGAAAFAVGQTYVTLSFRRGFVAGWAVGNRPREDAGTGSKRRRGQKARQEAAAEDTDVEPTAATTMPAGTYRQDDAYDEDDHDDVFSRPGTAPPAETAAEATAVYEPQPLPEDTGSYGVYTDAAYGTAGQPHEQQPQEQQAYAYDGYSGYGQQQHYGYEGGQEQYGGYSDPYQGTGTYGGGSYDTTYGGEQQYGQQAYGQDQYATGTYGETPPGGVWVPQQRTTDEALGGELPPEQPYPYQDNGTPHGNGYDERYRF
ncbi:SCO2102 family sporulation regulator [Streptomyces cynarae]|uniref:SCO2102 family sporulation regulator n=1 Tax=Streptomyces cynarae TaxID=2981134 RepID=UPI00406CA624